MSRRSSPPPSLVRFTNRPLDVEEGVRNVAQSTCLGVVAARRTAVLRVTCLSSVPGPDLQNILRQSYDYLTIMPKLPSTRDVVGWGRGGRRTPLFSTGGRVPTLPIFGLKFVQKLVHCCNWLLTETQYKIISVQQN